MATTALRKTRYLGQSEVKTMVAIPENGTTIAITQDGRLWMCEFTLDWNETDVLSLALAGRTSEVWEAKRLLEQHQ